MKSLLVLGALLLSGNPVNADTTPPWAQHMASKTCEYIERGIAFEKAGEKAAEETVKDKQYSMAFLVDYQKGTWEETYKTALINNCGETIDKIEKMQSEQ